MTNLNPLPPEELIQDFRYKVAPRRHQDVNFRLQREKTFCGIGSEMGTGKSFMLVNQAAYLYEQPGQAGKIDSLVVVAPKSVYGNWVGELSRFMGPQYRTAVWSTDLRSGQKVELHDMQSTRDALRVLLMNVEAFGASDKASDFLGDFLKSNQAMLCIDESTTIKSRTAARTKQLTKLGRLARYRRALTGELMPNGPMDVWAQCEFLQKGCLGIDSFTVFKAHYAQLKTIELRREEADYSGKIMARDLLAHEGAVIRSFFRLAVALPKTTGTGRPYVNLKLQDATGTVYGNRWQSTSVPAQPGEIVKVEAKVQSFNGKAQLTIQQIRASTLEDNLTPADFTNSQRPVSFEKITGYQNLDELKAKLAEHWWIVKKADCLDLPDKLPPVYRDVELSTEQRRAYDEMRRLAMVQIEEGIAAGEIATSKLVLTQALRLHQILCGFLTTDQGTDVPLPNPRMQELLAVLEECSGPVVIWCNYVRNVVEIRMALEKHFGRGSAVDYYSGTSDEDREEVRRAFDASRKQRRPGDPRFVVANETGAMGNTWTEAHTAVYFSYNYNWGLNAQSQDRIHRMGQGHACSYIYLRVRGTVEDQILLALETKEGLSKLVTPSNWKDFI